MRDKLLNDMAGALLTAQPSRKLIEDLRQESENVRTQMSVLDATVEMTRLKRDELALLSERLDAALPKLEATLQQGRKPRT
jgi:hypothetical protein